MSEGERRASVREEGKTKSEAGVMCYEDGGRDHGPRDGGGEDEEMEMGGGMSLANTLFHLCLELVLVF